MISKEVRVVDINEEKIKQLKKKKKKKAIAFIISVLVTILGTITLFLVSSRNNKSLIIVIGTLFLGTGIVTALYFLLDGFIPLKNKIKKYISLVNSFFKEDDIVIVENLHYETKDRVCFMAFKCLINETKIRLLFDIDSHIEMNKKYHVIYAHDVVMKVEELK